MKTKSSIHASARIAGRKIAPALGLIIVAALAAGDATAQVVVINPTGDASNVSGFASQLAKTVEQLQQQVAQYQQLLMTVEGLGTNISLSPNRLQPITDYSSLIDQNCPSSSGGSIVASVVTSIASAVSSSQSIAESQQQLCAQITMVQIDDITQELAPVNVPTTSSEHPNWRRKLSMSIEEIAALPGFHKLSRLLNRLRSNPAAAR